MVALYAFLILVPLCALSDVWRWGQTLAAIGHEARAATARRLLLNGVASFINQYSGLSVLDAMSSPLSHALANVMKRAAVITVAMAYAHRAPSPLHLFGVSLSVFGALLYQQLHKCTTGAADGDAASGGAGPKSHDHELMPLQPHPGARGSGSPGSGGAGAALHV